MQVQYTTFYIDGLYYGIDVMSIQEITQEVSITPVLRSSDKIKGLMNLRGRVATAIEMGRFFNQSYKVKEAFMTIICESDEHLYSLLVDRVGDVISLDKSEICIGPGSHNDQHGSIDGVFQTPEGLLRILSVNEIINLLEREEKGEVA